MIIDSHVYCFPPLDSPGGFSTATEHLRWVQWSHAGHHQPAWRLRDRTPVSAKPLAPEGKTPLSELPDVNFRADPARDRIVWTDEGEDCTKQFLPPNLRNLEYTPHSLISEMDYAEVDAALIHTNTCLTRDSAYLAECVSAYPDRLHSMAPVDEWRIPSEADQVIEEVRGAIQTQGLHAIKFMVEMAYLSGHRSWDNGPYRPFWKAVQMLKVPVFFTFRTAATPSPQMSSAQHRERYLGELRILVRWMDRYPDVVCSLTHGFPWRVLFDGQAVHVPSEFWKPFENPLCNLEVCFPVRLGDLIDYPYREVWPVIEEMAEKIGPHHLLWGTDMPFQNRACTYRQSRRVIEQYCPFLSAADRAQIMGGTAARILGTTSQAVP